MKKWFKLLTIICFIFNCPAVFAQLKEIDSLLVAIGMGKNDSSKVNNMLALSKKYLGTEPDSTIRIATRAEGLAEKINYQRGEAYAFKNIGIACYNLGKNIETLENWNRSLAIFDSIGDKVGEANILSNIGVLYFNQGSDEKALEYSLNSLKISEQLGDTFRIASALGNIGNIYGNKKATYDMALTYYLRALPLGERLGDKNILGSVAVGIGEIYYSKNMLDSALRYFGKSLKGYEGSEFVPYSLNDIGKVYTRQGNYNSAIKNHQKAWQLSKESDSKMDMLQSLIGLSNAYEKQGNYRSAIAFYKEAQTIAEELKAQKELRDIFEGLSNSYSEINDYHDAFKYEALLTGIKDTIYNIETDKKEGRVQFDFDIEKKQGEINLLTKDQELKEKIISRQKLVRNGFIGGFTIVLLFMVVFLRQRNKITKEKHRSDELLHNILPHEIATELRHTGTAKAKRFEKVTVLFTDFKNFTRLSEQMTPEEIVGEINYCYSAFDKIVTKYGVEKIKTIGDSYMCAGGLPVKNTTHAEDALNCAIEIRDFILNHKRQKESEGKIGFDIRIGLHTGPVVAGIVGLKKFAYDIWGDTVNTASRIESSGEPNRINISGTTYELVKDKFVCIHRGKIAAKNKEDMEMYFVEGRIEKN